MMPLNYPLRFQPVFRRYLWGGRGLGTRLHKPIGSEGNDWAESWEVVDHGADQSVVAAGEHAGKTLHELVVEYPTELFGRHAPQQHFPLLFKYLDANAPLSLQVHPNDDYARRMPKPDLGKTEAWLVIHNEPGSKLYAGLQPGVDRRALEQAIARDAMVECMHVLEPRAGDCIFIPAGVPHALGAGLVIAEIQQASDTTFRLFDWNRVGADGKPRPLHIEQGLEVIDYSFGPVSPQTPQTIDRSPGTETLVACDKFVLERRRIHGGGALGGGERFHIVSVTSGSVRVACPGGQTALALGETALLPAAVAGETAIEGDGVLIDMFLP
jgi:mannose-6-phosphate isomerase